MLHDSALYKFMIDIDIDGYPCGKFGDCSFSRFSFIVPTTGRQNHRHTHRRLKRLKPHSHRTRGVVPRRDALTHVEATTVGHLAIICILIDARRRGRCERSFTDATIVGVSNKT